MCQDSHEKQDSKSSPALRGRVLRSQEVCWCSMYRMRGAGNAWENMLANLLTNSWLAENSLENKAVTGLSFFGNATLPTQVFQLGRSYAGSEGAPGQSLTCRTAIL